MIKTGIIFCLVSICLASIRLIQSSATGKLEGNGPSYCKSPVRRNPFHVLAIPNMGLTLGEIFYLEELAADCASDGRWAFLLVAPPLPVTRGVGTPINPYAIK